MTRNGCSIAHQLAIGIVLLSIASQRAVGTQAPRPEQSLAPQESQLVELLGSGLSDFYYSQQQLQQLKQQLQQQHLRPKPLAIVYFISQLSSLRDLILSTDYDLQLALDSAERERAALGSRLLARLRRLSESSIDADDDQQRQPQQQMKLAGFKHSSKRDVDFRKQYMMPCHFKICNMGR